MCACDWSKSRHAAFTKSGYFLHEAILPPLFVNIASMDEYCLHVHSTDKSKQESCAIAKMTAQCAIYMGALKIFGTP